MRLFYHRLFFGFLLISLFFGNSAQAQTTNVVADYNFSYEILEDGRTKTTITGKLFNPQPDLFISAYSLNLSLNDIYEVKAADDQGQVKPEVEKTDSGYRIGLVFNEKVVGTEKPLSFVLSYSSKEIAKKTGLVWEVTIPKLADFKDAGSYAMTISVPNDFGPEIYVSPDPQGQEKRLASRLYHFGGNSVARTGVILSFGPYQIYTFKLKYNLRNPNLFTGLTTIALPPSILNDQEVIVDYLTPPPQNVEEDVDGNLIASYKVGGGKTTVVTLSGRVKILNPVRQVSQSGVFSEIPADLIRRYTAAQKYWQVGDPAFKKIIRETFGQISPQTPVSLVAKSLFEYVVRSLKYNPDRVKPDLTRFGAKVSLDQKENAVCMEFADLLVTLLRTAGIPSQVLEGFANTQETRERPAIGDVLHSWVRLYLPRVGWIAVDPTWANTTGGLNYFSRLDTNHFVFAVKGSDSERPFPAGAYKISPDQVGDIEVKVASQEVDYTASPEILKVVTDLATSYFNQEKKLLLEFRNSGRSTLFGLRFRSESGILPGLEGSLELGNLAPFGWIKKEVILARQPLPNENLGHLSFLSFEGKVSGREIFFKSSQKATPANRTAATVNNFILYIALGLGLCGLFYFAVRLARFRRQ